MRGVVLATALVVGACWTGSDAPVAEPAVVAKRAAPRPVRLRVELERTACFGFCPTYTVVIHGDGRVDWAGRANVLAVGHRRGRVSGAELEELSRLLDRVRFFERDEVGELPTRPECTTTGSTTTCSFATSASICSDTSHTIVSVTRGMQTHTIDNDNCNELPELEVLEDFIDRIANTGAWIGQ